MSKYKHIFRYLAGKLTGKAANRFERKALDDAFLYEALEGLEQQQGAHARNLKTLRRRLSERTHTPVQRNYYFREAAIIIIFLVVGGLLLPKLYEKNNYHHYADLVNNDWPEEELIFIPAEPDSVPSGELPVAPYVETGIAIDEVEVFPEELLFNVQVQPVDLSAYAVLKPEEADPLQEEAIPYVAVEQKPQFLSAGADVGEKGFSRWIMQHLRYPEAAIERSLRGRVLCSFVITAAGKVADVKVMAGVHPLLDNEALRVISSSPNWVPAMQRGRAVAVLYRVPVVFVLA